MRIVFFLLIFALLILPSHVVYATPCVVFKGEVQPRSSDPLTINGSDVTAVWNFNDEPIIEQYDYSEFLGFYTVNIYAESASLSFTNRSNSQNDLFLQTWDWVSCYVEDNIKIKDWLGNTIAEKDTFYCWSGHPHEEEPFEAWFQLLYPNDHFDEYIAKGIKPIESLIEIGDISSFIKVKDHEITIQGNKYEVTILSAKIEEGCGKDGDDFPIKKSIILTILPLIIDD